MHVHLSGSVCREHFFYSLICSIHSCQFGIDHIHVIVKFAYGFQALIYFTAFIR